MTNASYTQIILDNTSVYFIKNPQAEVELSECSDSLDYNGIYSTGIEFKLRMKAGMIKNFKIDNEALREIGINADKHAVRVAFSRNHISARYAVKRAAFNADRNICADFITDSTQCFGIEFFTEQFI